MQETKRKTKTSPEVRARYNAKVYTQIAVRLEKQLVADFKQAATDNNDSIASVFRKAITEYLMDNQKAPD